MHLPQRLPVPERAAHLQKLGIYLAYDEDVVDSGDSAEAVVAPPEDCLSEVDYDPSDLEDEAAALVSGPVTVTPALKRRRLSEKSSPPCFVPAEMLAVIPELLDDSDMARSLGVPIFSANFGPTRRKPRLLRPLVITGVPAIARPVLQALSGKESGQMYYASKPLSASSSAMRVLQAAPDLQTAYSRLPLLLSPSKPRSLSRVTVKLVEDDFYQADATTDGASDIGWEDAQRLGLLSCGPPQRGTYVLYSPEQFRGMFRLGVDHDVLGKGMLMVDHTRPSHFHLRRSCKKLDMHFPSETCSSHLGLHITKNTEQARRAAHVNCQVTAALAMRALSNSNRAGREAAMALLEVLCLEQHTAYESCLLALPRERTEKECRAHVHIAAEVDDTA